MRLSIVFVIAIAIAQAGIAICGEPDMKLRTTIENDTAALRELSVEQQSSEIISRLISLSEKYEKRGPQAYITAMTSFLGVIRQSEAWNEVRVHSLVTELAKKVLSNNGKEEVNAHCLHQQFMVFFGVLDSLDQKEKTFAEERFFRTTILLKKWHALLSSIDGLSWVDPKQGFRINPWEPPASYRGVVVSGMKPAAITDPVVRQEYTDYLKRRDEVHASRVRLKELRSVRDMYQGLVVRFLAGNYGTSPADRAKIRRLIIEIIKDKAEANELIRKMEGAVSPARQDK